MDAGELVGQQRPSSDPTHPPAEGLTPDSRQLLNDLRPVTAARAARGPGPGPGARGRVGPFLHSSPEPVQHREDQLRDSFVKIKWVIFVFCSCRTTELVLLIEKRYELVVFNVSFTDKTENLKPNNL